MVVATELGPGPLLWSDVEQTIPMVFAQVVARHGGRKAIGSGAWQPTYSELDAAANHAAHWVLAGGGRPGDRVALLMQHDAPLLAAVLGVLKAGRLFVVLHGADPPARMRQVMDDIEPRLLLCDAAHRDLAHQLAGEGCRVGWFDRDLSGADESPPQLPMQPWDAALLIYTSGSTGRSRGVIQTHRNILHAVRGFTLGLGYASSDRICLLGSLAGGQGVMTTFSALLNGATLYPYALRKRGAGPLVEWTARHKITVFIAAASVFRQFAQAVPADMKFPHLRMVRLGAEPARPSDLEVCRRLMEPQGLFANVLSLSETGNVAQFVCPVGDSLTGARVPVGRPVDGKTLRVVDEAGVEVAVGDEGEIVVQSRYLSPGYWRDPEATRARFREVSGSDERLYRTGDLGRCLPDGSVEHLGRKDRQHKLLGNRVDLRGIEETIRQQPAVEDAVAAVEEEHGVAKLCAWWVAREGGPVDAGEMRVKLGAALPASMIPARLIPVPFIPRTANGKPDVAALRALPEPASPLKKLGPRTPLEQRIAEEWEEVLQSPCDIYQNFFEAGGDSMQTMELLLRLSEQLKVPLEPGALIHHPTIAQFAEAVETGTIKTDREPWFRHLTASLLALREEGEGVPLLFVPGGNTSEGELLVFAHLLTHLPSRHPAFGVRLNLHARRVLPPWSLRQLAAKAGRAWLRQQPGRTPVVIGDCQAAALACEIASWLAQRCGEAPRLILLDPWLPRAADAPPGSVPGVAAVARYFKLLRNARPRAYPHEVHLLCARDAQRLQACREWWGARLGPLRSAAEVPGDHHSYVRKHRAAAAAALDAILKGNAD